ncbi:MAG TPA: type 2 isopentenyl-diphosphate Delta-isomerase [Bacteroidetes bacterium]|nr:type 2 isopentenyl-diphosphate Delta-isomerase [Bacteroidota bacterium]
MDKLERQAAQQDDDPTAASRKKDHIELALRSQVQAAETDPRFYYEPLLAAHPPKPGGLRPIPFLGKTLRVPVWVSSMTGGTDWARTINHNLARACHDFGMGMGLGSCRPLLFSDETLKDFDVREVLGDTLPLYANLGVAQVEQLIESNETFRLSDLTKKLKADGLIIHVNPLQEWMQPEGDRFKKPPIETIKTVLEKTDIRLIVKEVGQGMGRESLKALFQLPLQAVDFAASGGTNFSKLELLRSNKTKQELFAQLAQVGHTAEEMVEMSNEIAADLGDKMECRQVIISGGISNFLDGYYLINKLKLPCAYGQASAFLKHARGPYEELHEYVAAQVQGLELANAFLKIK